MGPLADIWHRQTSLANSFAIRSIKPELSIFNFQLENPIAVLSLANTICQERTKAYGLYTTKYM